MARFAGNASSTSLTETAHKLPLYLLGPISWLHHVWSEHQSQGTVLFEICETFPKQTHRHRIELLSAHGMERMTFQLEKPHSKCTTAEVELASLEEDLINLRKKLDTCYSSSPFYEHYADELFDTFSNAGKSLIDVNANLLRWLFEKLGENLDIAFTDAFEASSNSFVHLLKKNAYSTHPHPPYRQVFVPPLAFTPQLSALDLLFNLGPEARLYLLQLPKFEV